MEDVLPDVLVPGLDLVFCGNAAGKASARRGAYYAGPGNLFWPTLQAAKAALRSPVEYGRQGDPFAGAEAWVLPSPSGLARGFWSVEPWRELAAAVASDRANR